MEDNNSPNPVFDTNEQSAYFLTTLPANISDQVDNQDKSLVINTIGDIVALCELDSGQVSDQVNDVISTVIHNRVPDILNLFLTAKKRIELFGELGITNHSGNRKRYLDPLLGYDWVEMLCPDRKTSPKQMYQTTKSGKRLLKLMGGN